MNRKIIIKRRLCTDVFVVSGIIYTYSVYLYTDENPGPNYKLTTIPHDVPNEDLDYIKNNPGGKLYILYRVFFSESEALEGN